MLNLFTKKRNNNIKENIASIIESDKLLDSNNNNNQILHSSPSCKEWYNSIYCYNEQYMKLLVYKDKLVNSLFESYFNLTRKILQLKRKRFNHERFSANRVYLSKAEIKHTNSNVNITLFILNKNKNIVLYKLNKLRTKFYKFRKFIINPLNPNKLKKVFLFSRKYFAQDLYRLIVFYYKFFNIINKDPKILLNVDDKQLSSNINKLIDYKKEHLNLYNLLIKFIKKKRVIKIVKKVKNRFVIKKRSYKYLNFKNLNIYKFLSFYQLLTFNKYKSRDWFLNYKRFGLINIISNIYNKTVDFNLVNLKSMHLNSDIYTKAIALKLRNRKNRVLRVLKKALSRIKFPSLFILSNKDKKDRIIIDKKSKLLKSIKYKLISGVRFEASGRLTRRLIASRTVFKFRYVGSLKNIYSSYIGLPSSILRGHLRSNLQYTIINSKTPNGSFGLKGWTSSY